jgi:hypothetical protein
MRLERGGFGRRGPSSRGREGVVSLAGGHDIEQPMQPQGEILNRANSFVRKAGSMQALRRFRRIDPFEVSALRML